MVAKTDNEIYVLSTTNIYRYFSFVFSTVPKKIELLKISNVVIAQFCFPEKKISSLLK